MLKPGPKKSVIPPIDFVYARLSFESSSLITFTFFSWIPLMYVNLDKQLQQSSSSPTMEAETAKKDLHRYNSKVLMTKKYYRHTFPQGRAERHDFWSRFLLLHSPFLLPLFLGGKRITKVVVKSLAFLIDFFTMSVYLRMVFANHV